MMPETKPLWLIRPRLDASQYRDKLIGSVVKYPDLPTERYIPSPSSLSSSSSHHKTPLAKEIVPSLDPKPVHVHNLHFWTRRIKDSRVHASVSELLEGFTHHEGQISSEKTALVARVWHMERPGEKFEELIRDEGYFGELLGLLSGSGARKEGYFVTDIVSLVKMKVRDVQEKGNGVGASMGVPVMLDLNVGMGIKHPSAGCNVQSQTTQGITASYEEEIIVFLGYRLIRLEKVQGARAKLKRMLLLPIFTQGGWGRRRRRKRNGFKGFTVRDGFDYWPEMVERPVEGNVEAFLAAETPTVEETAWGVEEDDGCDEIVKELGFDVEVVG